jgi:GntR family transcriptional regulator
MSLHIDPHSGVPIYRQLQDQIRLMILSGLWCDGDEVPTTRALSEQLGVNPMTISKVYSLLEHEGWLERRRGRPLLVKARPAVPGEDPERLEMLRELLRPVAEQVRMLGIPQELALREWEQLLRQDNPENKNRSDH